MIEVMSRYSSIIYLLVLLCLLSACRSRKELVLGGERGVVLTYTGFTVSYNQETKIPNWVAYELTAEETKGTVKRDNNYYQDPNVKVKQADNDDYRNTGWDRGHMAPAGDMKWSEEAMNESSYFTNMCPQNRNLNGGDWKALEEKCRTWAQRYGKVQIVCGPIIGEMKNGTLGGNKVAIPDGFFKVLLIKVDKNYEGIGFVFENKAGHKKMIEYAVSIDVVESLTGLDFFHQLPDRVEKKAESEFHNEVWRI